MYPNIMVTDALGMWTYVIVVVQIAHILMERDQRGYLLVVFQ